MMRQITRQRVHLDRQDRTDKYADVAFTTTVAPKTLVSSSTSPKRNVYHYFHYRHENDYFHYHRHVNNYFHNIA